MIRDERSKRAVRIREEVLRIRNQFSQEGELTARIEKVILFGSAARGHIRSRSDIDLIVVQDTKKRFLDRREEVYRFIGPRIATDVLVYTAKEIEEMTRDSNRFLRHAIKHGEILMNEKESARREGKRWLQQSERDLALAHDTSLNGSQPRAAGSI